MVFKVQLLKGVVVTWQQDAGKSELELTIACYQDRHYLEVLSYVADFKIKTFITQLVLTLWLVYLIIKTMPLSLINLSVYSSKNACC